MGNGSSAGPTVMAYIVMAKGADERIKERQQSHKGWQLCKFFAQGECKKGEMCDFVHHRPERGTGARPREASEGRQPESGEKSQRNMIDNMRPGDWMCPSCNNHNYASRDVCGRCKQVPRPGTEMPGTAASVAAAPAIDAAALAQQAAGAIDLAALYGLYAGAAAPVGTDQKFRLMIRSVIDFGWCSCRPQRRGQVSGRCLRPASLLPLRRQHYWWRSLQSSYWRVRADRGCSCSRWRAASPGSPGH